MLVTAAEAGRRYGTDALGMRAFLYAVVAIGESEQMLTIGSNLPAPRS
jgi:hypothetical protein